MTTRKNPNIVKMDDDARKPVSNSSSSGDGYSVEARCTYRDPAIIGGRAYDKEWRQVYFDKSPIGVPERQTSIVSMEGYHSYAAAQALRWWFIAATEVERLAGSLCIETRLVRHRIEQTRRVTPFEYIDPQDGRGEIPSDMIAREALE